jgi:hypothetical protein
VWGGVGVAGDDFIKNRLPHCVMLIYTRVINTSFDTFGGFYASSRVVG